MSCQDTDHPGAVEASLLVLHLDIDVDGRWHGSLAVLFHYLLWLSSWFMIVLIVPFFLLLKVFMYDLHLYDYYQYSLLLVLLFFFLPFSCCCSSAVAEGSSTALLRPFAHGLCLFYRARGPNGMTWWFSAILSRCVGQGCGAQFFFHQLLKHHLKRKILFVPNAQKIT